MMPIGYRPMKTGRIGNFLSRIRYYRDRGELQKSGPQGASILVGVCRNWFGYGRIVGVPGGGTSTKSSDGKDIAVTSGEVNYTPPDDSRPTQKIDVPLHKTDPATPNGSNGKVKETPKQIVNNFLNSRIIRTGKTWSTILKGAAFALGAVAMGGAVLAISPFASIGALSPFILGAGKLAVSATIFGSNILAAGILVYLGLRIKNLGGKNAFRIWKNWKKEVRNLYDLDEKALAEVLVSLKDTSKVRQVMDLFDDVRIKVLNKAMKDIEDEAPTQEAAGKKPAKPSKPDPSAGSGPAVTQEDLEKKVRVAIQREEAIAKAKEILKDKEPFTEDKNGMIRAAAQREALSKAKDFLTREDSTAEELSLADAMLVKIEELERTIKEIQIKRKLKELETAQDTYKLIDVIRPSGQGEVWLAKNLKGNLVVIKILPLADTLKKFDPTKPEVKEMIIQKILRLYEEFQLGTSLSQKFSSLENLEMKKHISEPLDTNMNMPSVLDIARLKRVFAKDATKNEKAAILDGFPLKDFAEGAENQKRIFIVSEFIPEEEGSEIAARPIDDAYPGGIKEKHVEELFIPLLEMLYSAHKSGITHRDLKPDNLLVTQIDRKKFLVAIDLGIGKDLEADIDLTVEGGVKGTPFHMPPIDYTLEAEKNKDVNKLVDIYEAAIILYQMLTGENPIKHIMRKVRPDITTRGEAANWFIKKYFPAPVEVDLNHKDLPDNENLRLILAKALAPKAKDNYPLTYKKVKDPETGEIKDVLKTEPMRLFIDELKAALKFSAGADREKDTEVDSTLETVDPGTAPTEIGSAQLSPKRKDEVPVKKPRGVPGSLSPVPAKPAEPAKPKGKETPLALASALASMVISSKDEQNILDALLKICDGMAIAEIDIDEQLLPGTRDDLLSKVAGFMGSKNKDLRTAAKKFMNFYSLEEEE